MAFKKHNARPPHQQGADTVHAIAHHARHWEFSRFVAIYVRLLRESLTQEPKYFDE